MTDEKLPDDLGETGKELIAKFRKEIGTLQEQVKAYGDMTPEAITELKTELDNYKSKATQLERQVETFSAKDQFLNAAKQKIDQDYIDFAWKGLSSDVVKTTDGFLIGEKTFDDAITGFVEQYPNLAAKSVGANQDRGGTPPDDDPKVVRKDDFMKNLDKVASGEVEYTS